MTVAEMPEGTSHNSVPVYEFRAPSVFVAVCWLAELWTWPFCNNEERIWHADISQSCPYLGQKLCKYLL